MRRLRIREVKSPVQGHTVDVALTQTLLTTAQILSHYHISPFIWRCLCHCQDSFSSWPPKSSGFSHLISPEEPPHYLLQKQSQSLHCRRTCVLPPNSVHLISRKTIWLALEKAGEKKKSSPRQLHPPNYWIWGKFTGCRQKNGCVFSFQIDYCFMWMSD